MQNKTKTNGNLHVSINTSTHNNYVHLQILCANVPIKGRSRIADYTNEDQIIG